MMNVDTPALRLRYLIEKNGIKKKDFAEKTGVTPNTLSKILNERQPLSNSYAVRASELLGVSAKYIMCETDIPYDYENSVSAEMLSFSRQWHRFRFLIEVLKTMKFMETEKIIIGDRNYIGDRESGTYHLESNNHSDKYTEEELTEIIRSSKLPVKYLVDIQYKGNIKTLSYSEFLHLLKNLSNIIELNLQSIFSDYSEPLSSVIIEDNIQKAINNQPESHLVNSNLVR